MDESTRAAYDDLRASIVAAQFFAVIEADTEIDPLVGGELDHRIVCASKRRAGGGYCGTSFWISRRSGSWFLGTWGAIVYVIPDVHDVPLLCLALLEREFSGPMHYVPEALRERFGLIQVEDLPDR
jgi:hypothetical protein